MSPKKMFLESTAMMAEALRKLPPGKRRDAWAVFERKMSKEIDTPPKRAATRHSEAWKGLEREVAEKLRGKRISRGDNFARMDFDVSVPDFPELRIDAKYRNVHAHHTFVSEIERKYCTNPDLHIPVLVTKHKGQVSCYVTIPIELFGQLLDIAREFK